MSILDDWVMSTANTTTVVTYQQLSTLDYIYKSTLKKVKTDGLKDQPAISADNELFSTVQVVRADRFWADAGLLTNGPGVSVPAQQQTKQQCIDIHNRPGDVVPDLKGRAWKAPVGNWISQEFHPSFKLIAYYGASGTTPTLTIDQSAYPWSFDYGSGILTFLGDVPLYLSADNNVVYISGYTYTGIIGTAAVSGNFQAPSVSTDSLSINSISASNGTEIDCTGTDFIDMGIIKVDGVDTNSGDLPISVNSVETMRITTGGRVGINTASPTVTVDIYGVDAMRIPVGNSAERPTMSPGVPGYIRYNTQLSTFEGYGPGDEWGSLGGVKDVAGITYISAENTPGSADCNIRFVTGGVESMRVAANRNVGIGTTVAPYKLTVSGTTSTDTLYTSTLSTLSANCNIDVAQKNLSNIKVLDVSTISAVATSGLINASTTTMSNLTAVKTKTTETSNITTANTDSVIWASGILLCNLHTVGTTNVQVANIAGAPSTNVITMSAATLSNVGDVYVNNNKTLYISNLSTVSSLSNIDVSQKTLSNIKSLDTSAITAVATNGLINASTTTMSNLTAVKTKTMETSNITTANADSVIMASGILLCNLDTVGTKNFQVTKLVGAPGTNTIDTSSVQLSNIGNAFVQSSVFTNSINTYSGSNISFNNRDIRDIDNLYVNKSLQIAGEFFVTDVLTCNAERFAINNDGTGPALFVNQQGNIGDNTVASFLSASNLAFFVKGNRQAAFGGNFGSSVPSSLPVSAQVYIEAIADDAQDGLYVKQNDATKNIVNLGTASGANATDIVVDGSGHIGVGTSAPSSRLHVVHADNSSTEFMRFSTNTNADAVVVGADGRIGVGTSVSSTTTSTLTLSDNIELRGITAPAGTNHIDITGVTLSNTGLVKANVGSAASPTYTFTADESTGMFQPSTNKLAFTTNGTSRVVITETGTVGVGTDSSAVALSVYGQDAILIPTGDTSQRPGGVAGYIRYNTELSTFEGFGPGNNWGSLGGVKDVAGTTYISAEETPGSGDCNIRFITAGEESMRVAANRNVGVGTTIAPYRLTVNGATSTDTLYTNTLSTLGAYIDVAGKILTNLSNVKTETLETSFLTTSDASSTIIATGINLCNLSTVDTTALRVSKISGTNGDIDIDTTTLSNVGDVLVNNDSILFVTQISSLSPTSNIDVSQQSFRNISNVDTTYLNVSQITPLTGSKIDMSAVMLSNVGNVSINDDKTLFVSTISSLSAASNINVSQQSFSNIKNVDTANLSSSTAGGVINASNVTLSNMNAVDVANIYATRTNGLINMQQTSLSNLTTVMTTRIRTNASQGNIDFDRCTLSNVANIVTQKLSSDSGVIDAQQVTLCNLLNTKTAKVTTSTIESPNDELSMSWSKILDVDSIVVRSNISILIPGTNTITNLPTDVVRLDSDTGKILDSYISDSIVRLMNNGQINPALIPSLYSADRASFVKSMDKVGIGIRTPAQKLHVYGNQVITGGRLGIGTTTPLSSLHVYDDNASVGSQSISVHSVGSTDIMGVFGGSNEFPALFINSSCNVGIGTANPIYRLDVNGVGRFGTVRTTDLISDTGLVNCHYSILSNVHKTYVQEATIEELYVTGALYVPDTVASTSTTTLNLNAQTVKTNTITSDNDNVSVTTALNVTGFDTSLYTDPGVTNAKVGLSVSEYILAKATLTTSDERAKTGIVDSSADDDLAAVLSIPVKRFTYIDNVKNTDDDNAEETVGFIAQDVEKVAPFAVRTLKAPIPNVMAYATKEGDDTLAGLPSDKLSNIKPGNVLKVILDNGRDVSVVVKFVGCDKLVLESGSAVTGESIFVYGTFVDDFKVLENERLMPLVFNAVKQLHTQLTSQQKIIDRIIARLDLLEETFDDDLE